MAKHYLEEGNIKISGDEWDVPTHDRSAWKAFGEAFFLQYKIGLIIKLMAMIQVNFGHLPFIIPIKMRSNKVTEIR